MTTNSCHGIHADQVGKFCCNIATKSPAFTTLKAAREAGYYPLKPDQYGGDVIFVKNQLVCRNPKSAKSVTQWEKDGYRLKPCQTPHATLWSYKHKLHYDVYRDDQVEPKAVRAHVEPDPSRATLLPSIFAVNRAAKRWRETASSYYAAGMHGLARRAKSKKRKLYRLKARGIAYAFLHGDIVAEAIHGGLCLYRGAGYCFHSSLCPALKPLVQSGDGTPIEVEAKPQGTKEPRQKDAIAHLLTYPEIDPSDERFVRLAVPRREPVCYRCGEMGHIARECPNDGDGDWTADEFPHDSEDDWEVE